MLFAVAMTGVAGHFVWQIVTLDTDDGRNCLQRFRANHMIGLMVFLGIVLDAALRVAVASG